MNASSQISAQGSVTSMNQVDLFVLSLNFTSVQHDSILAKFLNPWDTVRAVPYPIIFDTGKIHTILSYGCDIHSLLVF